jgi:hypothetical protein
MAEGAASVVVSHGCCGTQLSLSPLLLLLPQQPCKAMRELAAARGVKLLLPQDAVVAYNLDDDQGCCTVPLTAHCCTPDAPCVPNGEPPMMKLALRVIVTNDTLVIPVMITIFITATPITSIKIVININNQSNNNNT